MTSVAPMLLAFSDLDSPLVDNITKERILDLVGRGCIYFNV